MLDLPVWRPELTPIQGPAYLGDRLEVRLRRGTALSARDAPEPAPVSVRLDRIGVADMDRLAAELGVWFEPEFRGETAPPPGSSETDFTTFYIVHLPPTLSLERALERFRELGPVESADPIAILPVSVTPDDSLWSASTWYYQPSRRDIHAPEAWDMTTGDTAIVVAILDTGVIPYHPDLGGTRAGSAGQIFTNWTEAAGSLGVDDDGNGFVDDLHGWDFVSLGSDGGISTGEDWRDADNDPNDFAGHGTAVAGVVGALSNNRIGVTGTAWQVRLLPLRIGWSARGAPLGLVDMSFVAQAIRYATRMGVDVINASFATRNLAGLFEAASAAVRAGITIVAAAGNDGQDHELAERPDVIAVAATDADDRVASFSNLGAYVDLAAPGNNITSTFVVRTGSDSLGLRQPHYDRSLSGTSFSAPMVAGAVALMQARRRALGQPSIPPVEAMLRLRETADDIAALNPGRSGYGAGRLNLFRALAAPPTSSAMRIDGRTVGPAVVFPTEAGPNRVAYVTTSRKLLIVEGRRDTVAVVTLPASPVTGVAAADLRPGRDGAMFVGLSGAAIAGFDLAGRPLSGWPVTMTGSSIQLSAGPALGDLDGDGVLEVVCGASNGAVWAWRADGMVVPGFPVTTDPLGVSGALALSDLDGSPGVEIVAAGLQGRLHLLRADGTQPLGWPIPIGTGIRSPVIGRLGRDPRPAIIVSAGAWLHAISANGAFQFSVPLTSPAGGTGVQEPALGDLDGDASDEIVVATRAPATLAVLDSAGARLSDRGWPRALSEEALGSPVIGQLRGDAGGAQEILVMQATGLLAFTDSAVALPTFPKPGGAGEAATLVDLDRGGATQVLAGTGPDSVLYVYDAGPGSAVGLTSPWGTPRGNFARTASRLYAPALTVPDLVAPAGVTDLRADSIGRHEVILAWTAPGDDGRLGQAAAYDVRRATFRLDEGSFLAGDSLPEVAAPGRAGTRERHRASGLEEGVTYFFALRARDEAGNTAAASNIAVATTGSGEPGRILDLAAIGASEEAVTLRWSATGDDGPAGRPETYLVRGSTSSLDDDGFETALVRREVSASQVPGGLESVIVNGLERARTYWFAVKARDDEGRLSLLSNVVVRRTEVGGPLTGRVGPALASRSQPSRLPVELYWQGAAASGDVGSGEGAEGKLIRIYDVAGRMLRALPLADEVSGVAQWNGRDDRGRLVPAGVYLARLTSGSLHVHTRVVLLP